MAGIPSSGDNDDGCERGRGQVHEQEGGEHSEMLASPFAVDERNGPIVTNVYCHHPNLVQVLSALPAAFAQKKQLPWLHQA